jgi:hypothetical protein
MRVIKTVMVLCTALILSLPCVAAKGAPLGTVDLVLDSANDGHGAYDIIDVWGGGHSGTSMYAGVYMLDKTGSTGAGDIWDNGLLPTFCIELQELVPLSTSTYHVVRPQTVYNSILGGTLGEAKAGYLGELWEGFFDEAWIGSGPHTSEENTDAAAFAAAVWEIVYEDLPAAPLDWDVTTDDTPGIGGFRGVGVDATAANSMLHALGGVGPNADLGAFVNRGAQDFIAEVPEPATIVLLGLSGMVGLLRR